MSEPEVVNNAAAHRFEIVVEGATAFADYRRQGREVTFPHTVVPPQLEGRGLASRLAETALDWARAEGLSVIPTCKFFETYIRRHPQTQDLLTPGERERLGLGSPT